MTIIIPIAASLSIFLMWVFYLTQRAEKIQRKWAPYYLVRSKRGLCGRLISGSVMRRKEAGAWQYRAMTEEEYMEQQSLEGI